MHRPLVILLALGLSLYGGTAALAAPVPLKANAPLIDLQPFYDMGPDDGVGAGNVALTYYYYIDIPYAIFDFGSTAAVTSATLRWDFLSLSANSGPASITLYVGGDADGVISKNDRFMGVAVDTFVYSGGELRTFNVTSQVNTLLAGGGRYFAARLEADVKPWQLGDGEHSGGEFAVPSLDAVTGGIPVPEPGSTLFLLGIGLAGLRAWRKRWH